MHSLELDDDDKLDAVMPIATDKPDFPWGTRICLTEKEFAKMGLDPALAEVGGMVHGHFMGRITSVSASDHESGSSCRVEIQMESLALESEDEENEDDDD